MKKFLLLFTVIFSSLFFTLNVKADEINQTIYNSFNNDYYDENYPYCNISISSSNGRYSFWCYDSKPYCSSGSNNLQGLISFNYKLTSYNSDGSFRSFDSSSGGSNSRNYGSFISYDCYDQNNVNIIIPKNISFGNGTPTLYVITFEVPKNSVITVKNSNNEEIQATSQYTYELEAGTYTYSVTNNLYNNLNNVSFIVSQDETINITMNERLNNQPIRSIYSQYYNYLSELVKDIFGLENPLFLYIVAFIIGFSLITLIRRLIGGR